MKPYGLIVNPIAGRGKAVLIADQIVAELKAREIPFRRWDTTAVGEGTSIAQGLQPGAWSRILVVGGDGTLNEVVNGLQQPAPPLAIIPAGTGNDVARLLGIRDPRQALETAIHGIARSLDVGLVDGRYFVNIFSFGFDAAVATQANVWKEKMPGWLLYPAALVKTVFSYKPPEVTLHLQGVKGQRTMEAQRILLMAVCNGGHYGGGMEINPQANPFDGELELCIVWPMPWWKILLLFPTVYKGKHLSFREVSLEKVTAVSFSASRTMLLNCDGETWPEQQASIALVSGGLSFMCPEQASNHTPFQAP